MAELIAIGYDDETTAARAAEAINRRSDQLAVQPDAVAVIIRDGDGRYRVTTSHHPVGTGATWGMFWGLLFGVLLFIPVFGMAVGAGLGALFGKIEESGIDKDFQRRIREMLAPGTSALFVVADQATRDETLEALRDLGGTVLRSSLSDDAQAELQAALHGEGPIPV